MPYPPQCPNCGNGSPTEPSSFAVTGPVAGVYTITHIAGDGTETVETIDVNAMDMDVNEVTVAGPVVTFVVENGGPSVPIDFCQLIVDNCGATIELNPDGSYTITGNDGDSETIGPITVTRTFVTGDILPYDATLPDGSTLDAGDPVPASVVITAEELPDGTAASTVSFESCLCPLVPDPANPGQFVPASVDPTTGAPVVAGTQTVVYEPGHTLTYDVALPDGTTLDAGDPVPDGVYLFNEENVADGSLVTSTAANICGCPLTPDPANPGDFIPAPTDPATGAPVVATTTTVVYEAGDGIGYPVVLPDGTTLPTGNPVPDGVVLVNEESVLDGALVTTSSFEICGCPVTPDPANPGDFIPAPTDPATGNPIVATTTTVVYVEGDTLGYDTTLPDGTTLTAGDPVPDDVVIVAEESVLDGALVADATFELPKCCKVSNVLCDPATDSAVVVVIDTGVTPAVATYFEPNGVAWAGDPATLEDCSAGGGGADVTDNTNGTATVTDGDGDACVFPTSIPVKCDGSDYDKGDTYTPLTKEDVEAATAVNLDAAIPHKLVGLDENGDCVAFDFVCEPGDEPGTIKLGGLQFEAVPARTSRITFNNASNTTMFDSTNVAGDVFLFPDVIDFDVPGCSNRFVNFIGGAGISRGNDGGGRILLVLERSVDGGAWVAGTATGNVGIEPHAAGQIEEESAISDNAGLAPGPHTIQYRYRLQSGPGIGTPGLDIRQQAHSVIIDAGHELRCC